MSILTEIPGLIKYKISLAVTFTAFVGFVLLRKSINSEVLLLLAGIFCLSSGAMVINQIQERYFDAKMTRTQHRPLADQRMTTLQGSFIAGICIITGIIILFAFYPLLTVLLGILNIIWYNGIYTPLKRITPFAVVAGSIIGAIPAVMGWIAAGGNIVDPPVVAISVFLIIWQIPHFWLILLLHNNDYEKAGFPGIDRIFSRNNSHFVIFAWVLATTGSSLLLPATGLITHVVPLMLLIAVNLLLIFLFVAAFFTKKKINTRQLVIAINVYMVLVLGMTILSVFL